MDDIKQAALDAAVRFRLITMYSHIDWTHQMVEESLDAHLAALLLEAHAIGVENPSIAEGLRRIAEELRSGK